MFSQSQDDIDFLTKKMECGNLYVNRSITGARVGIEPFGGYKLSGTGPKAGSAKYLEAFHVIPLRTPILTNLTRLGTEDPIHEGGQVQLAGPTDIGPSMLAARLERGLDKVLKDFEFLYQGIYGESKSNLYRFKEYIKKGLVEFCLKNSNKTIL